MVYPARADQISRVAFAGATFDKGSCIIDGEAAGMVHMTNRGKATPA